MNTMNEKEATVEVKSVCGACGEVAVVEEKGMSPLPGPTPGQWMEPDGAGFIKKRSKGKARRMRALGKKDAQETGQEEFLCGVDRKILTGAEVCPNCPGGCVGEKGLPALIEVEGYAEELLSGKCVASGYSNIDNKFIVQLEKSGEFVEAIFHGDTVRLEAWTLLEEPATQEKSGEPEQFIGMDEAVAIAIKSVQGDAINVEPSTDFGGVDSWRVEVDGTEGVGYDVYVAMDGKVLGYDEYEIDMKEDPGVTVTEVEGDPNEVDASPAEEAAVAEEQDAAKEEGTKDAEEGVEVKADEEEGGVAQEDDYELLRDLAEFEALANEE